MLSDRNYLDIYRAYIAPEIIQFKAYLEGLDFYAADIYSLGVCVIENLTGRRVGGKMKNWMHYLHGFSPAFMRILLRMVSLDPKKRPKAEELCGLGVSGYQKLN